MVMMEKLDPLATKDPWVPQGKKAVLGPRDLEESLDSR